MHLLQDPVLLLFLKLFLALLLGILIIPFVIVAFICLLLALVILFPAFCVFFLGLFLFKILFKNRPEAVERLEKQQQVSLELNSSEFSFGFSKSEESKHQISKTGNNLDKHLELWDTWNPDSVEIHQRKRFNDLLSFWRRLERSQRPN